MAYELYWISGSPYAWRVQLGLEVKGLAYRSNRLNPGEGEHKAEQYLSINPRGKVPALKDGELVVTESAAILAYIDAKHPEPPLFGSTPADRGLVWQLVHEVDFYAQQPVTRMIRPIFFGQMPEKVADVKAAALEVHEELGGIEQRLGGTDFMAGAAISAADMALLPAIQGILRAMGKDEAGPLELGFTPLADHYPNIAAWTARMEALPGYDNTYPPHWR